MSTNYLKGYLASIPSAEREQVLFRVREILRDRVQGGETILAQISEGKGPVTNPVFPIETERVMETLNKLSPFIAADLQWLYGSTEALESTISDCVELSSSWTLEVDTNLDDIEKSLDKLEAILSIEDESFVYQESFESLGGLESFIKNEDWLLDRNGRTMTEVMPYRSGRTFNLRLGSSGQPKDVLHDEYGTIHALITMDDYRGMPRDLGQTWRKAVDGSLSSYWDLSTTTRLPIDIVGKQGAMSEFTLHLPNRKRITEVALNPYCICPVTITVWVDDSKTPLDSITTDGTVIFDIPDTSFQKIKFRIEQTNYLEQIASLSTLNTQTLDDIINTLYLQENADQAYEAIAPLVAKENERVVRKWRNV